MKHNLSSTALKDTPRSFASFSLHKWQVEGQSPQYSKHLNIIMWHYKWCATLTRVLLVTCYIAPIACDTLCSCYPTIASQFKVGRWWIALTTMIARHFMWVADEYCGSHEIRFSVWLCELSMVRVVEVSCAWVYLLPTYSSWGWLQWSRSTRRKTLIKIC